MMSLGHMVTWSLGHLVTWSLGHMVTWSLGHFVTWSHGHLVAHGVLQSPAYPFSVVGMKYGWRLLPSYYSDCAGDTSNGGENLVHWSAVESLCPITRLCTGHFTVV